MAETLPAPINFSVSSDGESLIPYFLSVPNAVSYTLEYATSSTFQSSTALTGVVSGVALSGPVTGSSYFLRIKSVGDGTDYLTSGWSQTVAASPKETREYFNQIILPVSAINLSSPVRLAEFDAHAHNSEIHVPSGGTSGQILTKTATGAEWKTR